MKNAINARFVLKKLNEKLRHFYFYENKYQSCLLMLRHYLLICNP